MHVFGPADAGLFWLGCCVPGIIYRASYVILSFFWPFAFIRNNRCFWCFLDFLLLFCLLYVWCFVAVRSSPLARLDLSLSPKVWEDVARPEGARVCGVLCGLQGTSTPAGPYSSSSAYHMWRVSMSVRLFAFIVASLHPEKMNIEKIDLRAPCAACGLRYAVYQSMYYVVRPPFRFRDIFCTYIP